MGEHFNLFPEFLAGPYALLLRMRSEIGDLGFVECSSEQSAISLSTIVRALAEIKVSAMCGDARIASIEGIVTMARPPIIGG